PPGTPFLDNVARGVLARWRDPADPLALGRATILVPSHQAACALADSFARVSGGAPLLLPAIRPVGDPEEDDLPFLGEAEDALSAPPALSPLRRRLLLARLIHEWSQRREPPEPMTWGQAARLAASLMHLIDQLLAVRADLSALGDLVPESHAAHWRITLDFLRILREHWPNILAAEGATEPVTRHTRLLEEQARRWRDAPPAGPVIAAGFTHPATAALSDLLAVIAGLETGAVVLPGLDRELDEASWLALGPTHPQFGLRDLLQRIGLGRSEVRSWSDRSGNPVRARLLAEALRPADTTEEWAGAVRRLAPLADRALDGLSRIDAPGPREEAAAIALILRKSLEEPGQTAALVTPDRALARRVAAELRRWDIAVEDSAGRPLGGTAPGIFLRLLASAAQAEFAPAPLLALLKHPLASGRLAPGLFAEYVRRLERAVLRGPRPAPGLDGIAAAIEARHDWELSAWFADLSGRLRPFADSVFQPGIDLGALVRAHFEAAARLAETPDLAASPLWAGEAGSAIAGFAEDLVQAAAGIGPVDGQAYADLFEALIDDRTLPAQGTSHPRLFLWDLKDARLRQADLMVLAGLNETVWPPAARGDLWLNRPMRAAFGLPAPERRMGLSAHAFTQAACAPQVVLTRARKTDGAPTIASRWLVRLENLLKGLGREGALEPSDPFLSWVEGLDEPDRFAPARSPRPCPPRSSRPNRLS
ncbi:MAG TPA: double-strand break repair protein AddB, partial [Phenylobacterium sp.]